MSLQSLLILAVVLCFVAWLLQQTPLGATFGVWPLRIVLGLVGLLIAIEVIRMFL